MGHITLRPKYVLLIQAILSCHNGAVFERDGIRPLVLPNVSARLTLYGFPWNLLLGTFMKIRQGNSNWVKIGQFT